MVSGAPDDKRSRLAGQGLGGGGVQGLRFRGVGGRGRARLVGTRWLGGQAGQGLGAGCKGFGSGGVSGRGTGPRDGANFATCVVFLLFLTRTTRRKMAFFEGCPVGWRGGTHRSWPGGRGGRPRALIPGEGVREGLAWWGVSTGAGLVDGGSGRRGKGSGGVQGLRFRHGVQGRSKFRNVVFLLVQKEEMAFFGGYPPELAW